MKNRLVLTKGGIALWPQGRNGPFDDLTPNGWFGYSNENLVWIRHADLPESRCYLRVPEGVNWEGRGRIEIKGGTSVSWLSTHEGGEQPVENNYQTGMTWRKKAPRLFYGPCSLRSPLSHSPGLISASLALSAGGVIKVTVEMTNTSETALNKASAHFCFNHRRAPLLGRHIFVRSNEKWENFNDYKNNTPFRRYDFNNPDSQFPPVTFRSLFTSLIGPKGPFTAAIGGKEAIALSSNSEWPCTDIGVGFGDIAPGSKSARDFYIVMSAINKDKALESMEKLIR